MFNLGKGRRWNRFSRSARLRRRGRIRCVHRLIAANVHLQLQVVWPLFKFVLEFAFRRRREYGGWNDIATVFASIHSAFSIAYHCTGETSGARMAFRAAGGFDRMRLRFCQWASGGLRKANFAT